jgi:hypothetical protein
MAKAEAPRSGHVARVKDARGRTVTLLDPYTLHLLRRHEVIPAEPLRTIAEEVGPGVKKRRYLAFFACPVCVALAFIGLVIRKYAIGVGWYFDSLERLLWPLNLALVSLGAFMLWRSARRGRLKRVRGIMLRHRRCPHCGYDLRGLPTDSEDGLTVCPECGCAWRLADKKPA